MRPVRFHRDSRRHLGRALLGLGAAFCLVATLTVPASASLIPRPAASAAKDRPGPLPVTGPDTIAVAGGDRYITYGASTAAPRSVCGKPKQMGTAKQPKNCWVPYVLHSKGSRVGYAEKVSGDALPDGPGKWVNRNLGIWAPSVVHYRGKYYMFYTASQKGTAADPQARGRKCIGVATSTSARGDFHPRATPLLCRKGGWAIDAEAFIGRSNRNLYVTFRDDAATTGRETAISVARLDTSVRKVVKRKRLLTSKTIAWEGNEVHGTHIIENPSMIRAGDGTWWLFYSGNSWRTRKYATGIAKCGKDPISSCRPFPGPHRPYFGYVGDGGLTGAHKPIAQLPRNEKAPGGMSVFRARAMAGCARSGTTRRSPSTRSATVWSAGCASRATGGVSCPNKPVAPVAPVWCTSSGQRPTDQGVREMRAAFMSTQKGISTYPEDMTLGAHAQPRNPGACRRR